jgi:integrase
VAHTGIRLNELVDLRREDLDLAGGRLRIDQGNGRKDRVVYLSDAARQALDRYWVSLPPQAPDAPLALHAQPDDSIPTPRCRSHLQRDLNH